LATAQIIRPRAKAVETLECNLDEFGFTLHEIYEHIGASTIFKDIKWDQWQDGQIYNLAVKFPISLVFFLCYS
jgi:hypothetical protein